MPEQAFVYILASGFKHLYVGVTSRLDARMVQHKSGTYPDSFTARYNIHQLVYIERYQCLTTAIAREKQLKRWSRIKKLRLIISTNPTWKDLSEDWGQPLNGAPSPQHHAPCLLPPQLTVISTEVAAQRRRSGETPVFLFNSRGKV